MVIEVTFDVTDVYISTTVSPVYVNVSFEAPSGGGGTEWGDITGTLSNQTDLQTALDGKFDDPTGTALQYIDGTGALQTFPLTLPVLQEVRNQTGATLDAGTVVYINGATGNKPTVTKAIATGDATSAQTLGMVSASITNNGTGYVVVIGTCSGLDTSAYTEGQQLYLSYTTAGAVTTTKPYAPYHLVYIGIVTRAHPTLGTVEVRVQNGYELDEIHDVDALNPNNNDGIFYNSTTSLWEHKQISTALGYTPANSATTLTINGVTYDLSTSRTWTISTGIAGSGASGQVAYWDGTTSQAGSNNLFWDATNSRLGIGNNTPAYRFDITSPNIRIANFSGTNTSARLSINNTTTTPNVGIGLYANNTIKWSLASYGATSDFTFFNDALNSDAIFVKGSTNNVILGGSTTDNGQKLQVQGTTLLNGNVTFSSSTGMFWDATNSRLGIGTTAGTGNLLHVAGNTFSNTISTNGGINLNRNGDESYLQFERSGTPTAQLRALNGGGFRITAAAAGTEWARFHSTGNFGINTGATDTGERLQVTGTMKVTGASSFGENITMTKNSNAGFGVNIVNTTSGVNSNLFITLQSDTNSGSTTFGKYSTSSTAYKIIAVKDAYLYNNTTAGDFSILNDFASGNIKFAAGGSSTAHMTIKSNGRINMSSLPTSSTGLVTGDLWNDAGTIKIV